MQLPYLACAHIPFEWGHLRIFGTCMKRVTHRHPVISRAAGTSYPWRRYASVAERGYTLLATDLINMRDVWLVVVILSESGEPSRGIRKGG
jgi:hypothetical protein